MTRPRDPAAGPAGKDTAAGGALVFVDAIEGDYARLLLGVDAFDAPVRLLPPGAKEGSWLRLSVALTPAPPDDADAIRKKLSGDDDGGDIKL